ncbi:MAG: MoaD/ThiS family protein [Pseudomonadota bacterium]
MKISVTLFGALRHFLPAGSGFNKCEIELDAGSSLKVLLEKVPVPADKPYLVMHNDTRIAPEQYDEIEIQPADEVILLPPLKGG